MHPTIVSLDDIRHQARRRLPQLIFDFIDGAAGNEGAKHRNRKAFEEIYLQPRALFQVEKRSLHKNFLNQTWDLPFGIAPMGMCNLAWPSTDQMLATAAANHNIPVCLSTAGSSTIENMHTWAGENAWFQLYVGGSIDAAWSLVERAKNADYKTLILTVDVPTVAPR